MPFLTMPALTKIFLTIYLILALSVLGSWSPKPNIMPEYPGELRIISTIDSYKNTTLSDTNQQMIALQDFLTTFYVDFKYADPHNFTRKILYTEPAAYLRLPAANALQKVINTLKNKGLGIKIFDAYRPYRVTKIMWKVVPDVRFAADPAKGSVHNRGAAIDLTLVDEKTGIELEMPTRFDDFSAKAHHSYMQLPESVWLTVLC
jgi:D-alanyl-D-alanine dipeptidase